MFGEHITSKWHDYIGNFRGQTNVCIKRTTKGQKEADTVLREAELQKARVNHLALEMKAYQSLVTNDEGTEGTHSQLSCHYIIINCSCLITFKICQIVVNFIYVVIK